MAVAFVAATSAQKTGQTNYTGPTNGFDCGTFAAGEFVVIAVAVWAAAVSTIVWGTGGSTAPAGVVSYVANNPVVYSYVVKSAVAGAHRLDVGLTSTADCTAVVLRFTGVTDSVTARDTGSGRQTATTTPSRVTTGTAGLIGDLAVGVDTHDGGTAAVTAGANYTTPSGGSQTSGSFVPVTLEYDTDNVSVNGAQTAGWTWISAAHNSLILVFAPGVAAAVQNPWTPWPQLAPILAR